MKDPEEMAREIVDNLDQAIVNAIFEKLFEDIEGGAKEPVYRDPDTGLSVAGRTMKREVYAHLCAVISRMNAALKQLDYIPDNAGAQNTFHNPSAIVRDNLTQARIVMSWAARYLDELEEPEVKDV